MKGSAKRVPFEIWTKIFSLLVCEIPKPLSRPDRIALSQIDLCNLARVSRLFSSVVNPLLYGNIVTDNIWALLKLSLTPPMKAKLAFTRRLYIEYCPRGEDTTYPYLTRWGENAWGMMGRTPEKVEEYKMQEAKREIQRMATILHPLTTFPGAMPFPNLQTVAIGSIYGKRDEFWAQYLDRYTPTNPYPFDPLVDYFDHFLAKLPKLKHLCIRDCDGPLSIATNKQSTYPIPKCTRTIHFGENFRRLYLDRGVPNMRLVSDLPQSADLTTIFSRLKGWFGVVAQSHQTKMTPVEIIDAEVYCMTQTFSDKPKTGILEDRRVIDPKMEGPMAKAFGEQVQDILRKGSGVKDVVKWYPSRQTPFCRACGSGPPQHGWHGDGLEGMLATHAQGQPLPEMDLGKVAQYLKQAYK